MLRPLPNHGTLRLTNDEDKYLCLSSFVSTLLVLFEDSSVGSLQKHVIIRKETYHNVGQSGRSTVYLTREETYQNTNPSRRPISFTYI